MQGRARAAGRARPCAVLCLAAAVCFAGAHGAGGKGELRDLLAQARKLNANRPQDAAQKMKLLKQAAELDPTSLEAARELALASAHQLLGPRLPDDPTGAPATEAVAALERYRYGGERAARVGSHTRLTHAHAHAPSIPGPRTRADARRMAGCWRRRTRARRRGRCATRS